MKKHLLIILLLFIGTMAVYPQIRTVGSDSERNAEYKKAIGLDTTVPDFDTNKIDAKEPDKNKADVEGGAIDNSKAIVTNSFWDNWYAQVGVDMNLLFPSHHSIKDVFPNGKSFGVNVAIGKWFSPEFGGRFKVVWNNGILPNDHNTWLAPYGVPGENHRHGGFLNFIWDVQVNMHNLLGSYNPDRKWDLIVAPRAGGWWDNYADKGCPILGVGIINTFRLSNKWSLYVDAGYHFVASINGIASGTDHGGNSFAEINVGVQYDLRKKSSDGKWKRVSEADQNNEDGVALNHFWDNWFVQAGLGMSLINPYNTNFKYVFPNGSTYGLNVGFGKWFTPEAGVRVGANWQNGIIVNHHASYLDSNPELDGNPNKHGFISLYADMFFNLHYIFGQYDANRKWNAIIFPRFGLAENFPSSYSECPILGFGTEQTFTLNNRLKLYADFSYQVTTGGFLDAKFGGDMGLSHNGWFDINIGVQYELGQVIGWNKPGKERTAIVNVTAHNWPRFIVNTGASVVVAFGAKTVLKAVVKEDRPDHSDNKSFPSGHASMAFAAARSIDKEFRSDCIWIPIAGYAAATAIGVERVVSERHHWYDVVAGAGIGFGAAELTWWLSDLMFGKGSRLAVGSSGNTVDMVYIF